MGVKQTIASFCPVWAISWWKRRPHKEDILLKHPIRYFGEGVLLGRSLYQAYRGCIKLRIDTFCLLLAWATLSNLSARDLGMMLSSNEIWYNGGCGVGCVSQADVRNEGRLGTVVNKAPDVTLDFHCLRLGRFHTNLDLGPEFIFCSKCVSVAAYVQPWPPTVHQGGLPST